MLYHAANLLPGEQTTFQVVKKHEEMSEKIYEKLSDKREILSRFIAIQAVLAEILMNYFPLISSFVDCKKNKAWCKF